MSEVSVTVSLVDTGDWLTDIRTSYDTVADSYSNQNACGIGRDAVCSGSAGIVRRSGYAPHGRRARCGRGLRTRTRHCAPARFPGLDAFGIDLSSVMIDVARREATGLRFEVGSMTDLPLADASVAGLVARSGR